MAGPRSGWRRRWSGHTPEPEPETEVEATPSVPGTTGVEPARIDPGCEIEGQFALDGPLDVDGEFRGSIHCGATVTVSEHGSVEASIECREAVIHGAVVGDISGRREIVLRSTARVHGNLTAPSIVIERGAFYQGETRMFRPERRVQDETRIEPPIAVPES